MDCPYFSYHIEDFYMIVKDKPADSNPKMNQEEDFSSSYKYA